MRDLRVDAWGRFGHVGLLFVVLVMMSGCGRILGIQPEEHVPFAHREHVLEGITCVQCHEGVAQVENHGPLHMPGDESCRSCHEEPHDQRSCISCHTTEEVRRRASANREHLNFEHRRHTQDEQVECVRCHSGIAEGRDLEAQMGTCLSCHQHDDQFERRRCEGCHQNLHAELSPPQSHLVHDLGFVRSHGVQAASAGDLCATCHAENFCASCHGKTTATLKSRLAFDRPMAAGVHRAGFLARHSFESSGNAGLCTTCHTERFCRDCHVDNGVGVGDARSPHPAGWVGLTGNAHGLAARRDPLSCASCHGGAGEALCVKCHAVGAPGGSPHPPGFTSSRGKLERPCRFCHIDP